MHQTNKQTITQRQLKPTKLLMALFMLGTFIFGSSCKKIKDTTEIKLAHALEVTHPVHLAMLFMAEKVKEKSGGKMVLEIYPNAQLGSERECLELLQIGSLGMTKVSAAVLESFSPNYKVLSLPYIFKTKEHYYRVLESSIGDQFLAEGEKYWFKGLTFYDAGSRSFYSTRKPINRPEDLKGMNIRVQLSPTAIAMINAFGGAATPTAWGELYTALQQGVVDGAENNLPSFYLSRHYEVSKYLSLNEHTMVPDVLMVSTVVWDQLNDQEKKWLQEAADESAVVQRQLWAKAEAEALAAVKKAGVEVSYPDKEPFSKLVEPLYETYRNEPEVYSLIKRIEAAEKAPAQSEATSHTL
ncbi:TRAP transporter substrate-binding protein [Rufibacter roseus]|uniref:TRAP transporter substrate-binding protein n=1 Tax=Rufibacter roseus TaxID=1567108 RepID=A0ABW2DRK4_9BACT|nr:TRAP transporter substrate-binding protein [Rufibacter roseus]